MHRTYIRLVTKVRGHKGKSLLNNQQMLMNLEMTKERNTGLKIMKGKMKDLTTDMKNILMTLRKIKERSKWIHLQDIMRSIIMIEKTNLLFHLNLMSPFMTQRILLSLESLKMKVRFWTRPMMLTSIEWIMIRKNII